MHDWNSKGLTRYLHSFWFQFNWTHHKKLCSQNYAFIRSAVDSPNKSIPWWLIIYKLARAQVVFLMENKLKIIVLWQTRALLNADFKETREIYVKMKSWKMTFNVRLSLTFDIPVRFAKSLISSCEYFFCIWWSIDAEYKRVLNRYGVTKVMSPAPQSPFTDSCLFQLFNRLSQPILFCSQLSETHI